MLNSLIPYVLGAYNFKINEGVWGIRVYVCSLDNFNLTSFNDLDLLLKYCTTNNIKIDCYEYSGDFDSSLPCLDQRYNNLSCYTIHRLRTKTKINELLQKGVQKPSSDFYLKPYIMYNNNPICMFVPNIDGNFKLENNMLMYNGEKKIFILPNDNYRHIDVMFYNKIFINLLTGEIVGRYSGLDNDKQYIKTEEYWDRQQNRWFVTKKRKILIAGYKTAL